ncbi:SGNH/GDSL hydrolase family protein [Actinomadura kijaniata]|uniref:Lysophospholipase L1-like esterase n=1 Tax=Actinomadura namibiensis TaxID=182080 RepID=A0A7W3LLT4_ACTNM|nr:SGNH/GDSL hydrolase family protein [Actinomadura namibiensis]MBA8950402.1 lysophospholipase L1-like esterase [Actinomadura namibiensis]
MRKLMAATVGFALVAATPGIALAARERAERTERGTQAARQWTAAWAAAPQRPSVGFEPNWSEQGFSGQTVRQVMRITAGGSAVRVRLSNRYGASPLKVAAMTVAKAGRGPAVRPGSLRHLTFGRSRSVVVPVGGQVVSDGAELKVAPLESLTVTMYLPETTGPATAHLQGYATAYRAQGDRTADAGGAFPTGAEKVTHSRYYLSGIDVAGGAARRDTVVAFGDSITDGFGAGNDTDARYPDALAERLAKAGRPRPVLNAGIGGNMILSDSAWFGDRGLDRFRRDALADPRVGTVVVLHGLNDIGFSEVDLPTYKPNPDRSLAELVAGHRALIRQARARGVKVIGATLLPMKGAEYHTPRSAEKIRRLNHWIRTSGEYDAVADFNRAVADPRDPERLRAAFDSGDHKHPNAAGYRAMADAVDLAEIS